MSLRDSLELIRAVRPDAGHRMLEGEILAERASSLGAAEARVKARLLALATGEEGALGRAQAAVWAYFVQRELCGFRRHADVIADLRIPAIVLNGLGAMPSHRYR
jgi:hypothetical protein